MLHSAGFNLIIRTLKVADFVLSPEICIERKGIPDLFSSFNSGRLYHQVEEMCKFYQFPCLLIEFQLDKAFSLQSPGDLTNDININNITSKITLLSLAFPKLR
jgi:DNA excision repair protein ERCC-4